MTDVKVIEREDSFAINIERPAKPNLTLMSVPDERAIELGLYPQGKVEIMEVAYPKSIYEKADIEITAGKIKEEIAKPNCTNCAILSLTEKTKKTFLIPTFNDIQPPPL